ncbi:hypothetical protein ACB094_03G015200 [Castanea mollissima]
MRSKLIRFCGEAEGLLESHYSTILGSYENPLDHLDIFPCYSNYLKLSLLAFVGSGPLPLTSIILASKHLTKSTFYNYDINPLANSQAIGLFSSDSDLSKRMFFHTNNIMNVTNALKDYEVFFLAALVGMDKEDKVKFVDHLAKYMAPGAPLMLRSAHGARDFLYPVLDPCDLRGFEFLSVFHPTNEVINSVVIARKYALPANSLEQGLGPIMLSNT